MGNRYLYFFDRGTAGVIKWDSQTDTGKVIAYPYKTAFPGGGQYEHGDNAVWCKVWDHTAGRYVPKGIARLDLTTDEFTGWYYFPDKDDGLAAYTDPDTTLFLPHTLKGKIVPFDYRARRWCRFIDVPRYGELFGFMGGPWRHNGRRYYSLNTYNGTETGCDGKPFHFCNAILEFDPKARRFDVHTLEAKDAYFQIAYMLSAGGDFYATGTNIRQPDGRLDGARAGAVVFWQTRPVERK